MKFVIHVRTPDGLPGKLVYCNETNEVSYLDGTPVTASVAVLFMVFTTAKMRSYSSRLLLITLAETFAPTR